MTGITALDKPARTRIEHRDLSTSMERVREELEKVRSSPDPDHVHDLRVAIRRCRSIGLVFEEVDFDPAWPEMRKVAKKLFRALGASRDSQIMDDWVKENLPANDPVRAQMQTVFESEAPQLREEVLRVAEKFSEKGWARLERRLRQRVKVIPVGGLAAECLAWERFEEIRELHAAAMRRSKPRAWHALRIGLKRLRYTVESLLPIHHSAWSENLKRLQDLLGDIHDLDVLKEKVKTQTGTAAAARRSWKQLVERERGKRVQTYRHLTLGKASIWNKWKHGLPHGERLEAAALARLKSTARASQRPQRVAQTGRIALRIFDLLRRAKIGRVFGDPALRRVLQGAGLLHGVSRGEKSKRANKTARKLLMDMPVPPGWSSEDWNLLGWTVRYHRGGEPKMEGSKFSELTGPQQEIIRGLAGVLRLARVLQKTGITTATGMKMENSQEAVVVLVPNLADSVEAAAKLAAGKHLLETAIGKPVFLRKPVVPSKVIALPSPVQHTVPNVAMAAGSD